MRMSTAITDGELHRFVELIAVRDIEAGWPTTLNHRPLLHNASSPARASGSEIKAQSLLDDLTECYVVLGRLSPGPRKNFVRNIERRPHRSEHSWPGRLMLLAWRLPRSRRCNVGRRGGIYPRPR